MRAREDYTLVVANIVKWLSATPIVQSPELAGFYDLGRLAGVTRGLSRLSSVPVDLVPRWAQSVGSVPSMVSLGNLMAE